MGPVYLRWNGEFLECTKCGAEYDEEGQFVEDWLYCPTCGGALDGVDDPEEIRRAESERLEALRGHVFGYGARGRA